MKLTALIVAATVGMLAAGGAEAMPIAAGPMADGGAPVILARGGYGFGAHRGPMAGCRLNRGPRGVIRQAITGAPRGCPPDRYRVRGICRFR